MELKDKTPRMGEKHQIANSVRAVRQVAAGVQAQVCVGATSEAYVWLTVTSSSPAVQEAMVALRDALRADADRLLKAAQDDTEGRGGAPVGRR